MSCPNSSHLVRIHHHSGRYARIALLFALLMLLLALPVSAQETTHVVQRGEYLSTLATRYGTTVQAIVSLNGLANPNMIFVGQRLRILSGSGTSSGDSTSGGTSGGGQVHIVQRGEILSVIAARYGTTASAIALANQLQNPNLIWVGQRLQIPGAGSTPSTDTDSGSSGSTGSTAPGSSGKWIEVILSNQTTLAWEGQTLIRRMIVSTGLPGTPTVTGTFQVYVKYLSAPMSGPGYYLPGVPHTMYFYRGYALHGAYWHNNFGHPMSHGCVNLSLPDAAWLYNWTPMGTTVVVHW